MERYPWSHCSTALRAPVSQQPSGNICITHANNLSRPYLFSPSELGLVFLSPLIGSLVGTYLCGPLADMIALRYTQRNDGIREPEMRLPTCIIAAAITFLGAVVLAVTYHYKTHWAGPVIGYGILSAGAQMGATLAMTYSLDCHKEVRSWILEYCTY